MANDSKEGVTRVIAGDGAHTQMGKDAPRDRESKYPFKEMQPGDHLFIPCTPEEPKPWKTRTSLTWWANNRYGDSGARFMTRKHKMSDGTLGVRISRVK